MSAPDAPRPPVEAGGRASDRASKLIGTESTPSDRYPRGATLAVLHQSIGRPTQPQSCRCCQPPEPRRSWLLRDDLVPLTFEEAVAAGLIDADALAVPVVETNA